MKRVPEPASIERSGRIWILYRETPFDAWQVWPSTTAVDLPKHFEILEVVPASEVTELTSQIEALDPYYAEDDLNSV